MIPFATNLTKDELARSWIPVWIAHESDDILSMADEHGMMMEWCRMNCTQPWTISWYQDNLAFWFRIDDDAMMFRMVWIP